MSQSCFSRQSGYYMINFWPKNPQSILHLYTDNGQIVDLSGFLLQLKNNLVSMFWVQKLYEWHTLTVSYQVNSRMFLFAYYLLQIRQEYQNFTWHVIILKVFSCIWYSCCVLKLLLPCLENMIIESWLWKKTDLEGTSGGHLIQPPTWGRIILSKPSHPDTCLTLS